MGMTTGPCSSLIELSSGGGEYKTLRGNKPAVPMRMLTTRLLMNALVSNWRTIMEDKHTYRVPEGFNPNTCMDTVRGLTDAPPAQNRRAGHSADSRARQPGRAHRAHLYTGPE